MTRTLPTTYIPVIDRRSTMKSIMGSNPQDTMELASLCPSEISDFSKDTFELARTGKIRRRSSEQQLPQHAQHGGQQQQQKPTGLESTDTKSRLATHLEQQDMPHRRSNGPRRNRVRFSDLPNTIINTAPSSIESSTTSESSFTESTTTTTPEYLDEEDISCRWWTQDDLEQIKKEAKEMSILLRRASKEKGCYVEQAHKKTSLMLSNDFKSLVKLTPSSPDQDLVHWCLRSDGRRGLERFASKGYSALRKEDIMEARRLIFEEQERQRSKQINKPEIIAKIAKEASRRARTFSLFMGEADHITSRSRSKRPPSKKSRVEVPETIRLQIKV